MLGIFGFLNGPDIHKGLQEWKSAPDAVLLDVRTVEEYKQGHVPGSINIPLKELDMVN